MTERTCTVPGCSKPLRNKTAELCGMHYHRQYRHGSVDKVATSVSVWHGRRYRTTYKPGHPLASKHGNVRRLDGDRPCWMRVGGPRTTLSPASATPLDAVEQRDPGGPPLPPAPQMTRHFRVSL